MIFKVTRQITWCNAYLNTSKITDLKEILIKSTSTQNEDLITVIWVEVISYFRPGLVQ